MLERVVVLYKKQRSERKMVLTDEEIRLKAVEIAFRSADNMLMAAIASKQAYSWNKSTYFEGVDDIVEYVKTGKKPVIGK
jgi:cystathionine beta-lyase family protein involved in aluminum resistance